MKRRYLCVGVSSFVAGILSFNAPYNLFWIILGLLLTCGIFFLIKSKKVYLLILGVMFLTGGLYGNYTQNAYKNSPLYEYTQKPGSGKMFVKEIQTKAENYVTVKATVTEVCGKKANETILFTIYNLSDVKVNTVIYFNDIKFKIPERERNRGGFNYNRYLKSKGIYFTASAPRDDLKASGSGGFFILKKLRTFKQNLTYRSIEVFKDSFAAQIMPALLTGNDVLISEELDGLFKNAGITHILVASGMHVTVIMLLCAFLLYPLRKYRWLYYTLSGLVLITFGGIVGTHPSIIRAIVTYFTYLIARNTLKSADSLTVLFEAAFVILLINPLSIYNVSFLLSFGAISGIILFTPHIIRRIKWVVCVPPLVFSLNNMLPAKISKFLNRTVLKIFNTLVSAAAVSLSAQIGVLPIMFGTFKAATMLSIFVNVIISFTIPFLYAFGIIALILNGEPFVGLTKLLCDLLVKGARVTGALPGNNVSVVASDMITVAVLLFVVCLILRCKTKWFDKLFEPLVAICVGVALLSSVLYVYVPKDKVKVTFLNVEQGDCAIIRLHGNKTVIIDTGTENMCRDEVFDYMQREGIDTISALILSHSDSDHSGGANMLIENANVEKVITSTFFESKFQDTLHTTLSKGEEFSIENAKFTVISPTETGSYSNENDSSLVVRMDFGKSSFLFTGDMGLKVENTLRNVDVDVLKVSHHGSKTASSEEFIKRVSPQFAVISVDKDNSYGHPDSSVIETLENAPCEVLRTDKDYTITFTADLNGEFALTKGL